MATIVVKPLRAEITHDVDWFSKMDPYCLVCLGATKFKTKTCPNGGK